MQLSLGCPSGTGVKAAIWSDWGLPLTAPPQMHTLVVDARKGKFVIPIPGSLFIFVLIFHIKNDENKNPATSASSKQLLRTIFLCLFLKNPSKNVLDLPSLYINNNDSFSLLNNPSNNPWAPFETPIPVWLMILMIYRLHIFHEFWEERY